MQHIRIGFIIKCVILINSYKIVDFKMVYQVLSTNIDTVLVVL